MTVKELQKILSDILREFNSICRKEGIQYSLAYGTMLGAVRHKGFIPWDDDIDVFMWEDEYAKLKKCISNSLSENYKFVEPGDMNPYFFDLVPRVVDTRYYWHTPTQNDEAYNNLQNYVALDIFVLNRDAKTYIGRKLTYIEFLSLYGMAKGHSVEIDMSSYSKIQKIGMSVLSAIGEHISLKTIFKWYYSFSKKYNGTNNEYCTVSNFLSVLGLRQYRSEWFSETVDMQFEDIVLPVFKRYDDILKFQYGDYMQPPKDKSIYKTHLSE
jgi:lipopolysaccharide cholinephosphotransferase